MIEIEEVVLHRVTMPLQMRFETSFGVQTDRDIVLVELQSRDGSVGWGESVALRRPLYNEETTDSVEAFIRNELVPVLLGGKFDHPRNFNASIKHLHGNRMAKYAVESALWDIQAQQQGVPLATLIGGTKSQVDVGVSLGISPIPELLEEVRDYVNQGYRRIKVKVKPGWDVEPLDAIRQAFPDIPLMVDANTAYGPEHEELMAKLDQYELMMIEQPFPEEAWELYARVQAAMRTPLCLDESIHTVSDAEQAIRLKACRIINVKLGRIGGIEAALDLAEVAGRAGIQLWCGGMLETGIGRAYNVAIASLSTFTLPGDTAASRRYWNPDIIDPEVTVDNGQITVPSRPGIGYRVNEHQVARYQRYQVHFRRHGGEVSFHE